MNVLFAGANIPNEKLIEMDEINDEFANTDIALIIGANDVVNPPHAPTRKAQFMACPS